jgi:ketosteroid isomerase-like protein
MTEQELLLERDRAWSSLASEGGDVDAMLSYWTDDAVLIAPGLPPVAGKEALRQYVLSSLNIPGFNIKWHSTAVHISEDKTLAYMFSENAVTMNGPDGTPVTVKGRAVTIWRREADGEWRCAVDIWNS